MQAYRVETTLQQDGTLTLSNLPLHAGETVEVISWCSPRWRWTASGILSVGCPSITLIPRNQLGKRLGRRAMIILDTHIWVWWGWRCAPS